MKNKVKFVVFMVLVVVLATSCASIFGGGDWKSGVVDTLVVEHDEFTMETKYSMQESGLYYSILPVKLEYTTGDEDIGDDPDWRMIITQYDTMNLGASFTVDNVAIMNSRGDRFNADIAGHISMIGDTEATGGIILNDDEIAQLYQVFTDVENLEYIRIRFNGRDDKVYDMTQPQAYAVTYFIDYIRNTVQPTEV